MGEFQGMWTVSQKHMSVTQQQILLLTFRLLFQIKTCLCRERPTGQAAPARAQPPLPSIWPQPCGPGGAAPTPCCSSGTPAGPPGERRHGPYCTEDQRRQLPSTRAWGRGGKTLGWEVRTPSLSTWKPGHTAATGSWGARPLGGLTSADFWVVVREQRQKWDSLQGTWEHCSLDPINLVNVTDPCAFAIGKFVNHKIFIAWIGLKKKKSL